MEVRIEWSGLSEGQLKDIFDYYSVAASQGIARRIINRIIDKVSILQKNPYSGHKEELLSEYPDEFRYLVEGNYKIIYWVQDDLVTIASIFDCRQNPLKMKKIK